MRRATITPTDNGPYLIQGKVTLTDADGNSYQVDESFALCRCGFSATKPFCDGSHEKTYFHAVNRAGKILDPRYAKTTADRRTIKQRLSTVK